ncbi:hypothetical protein B0H10DRAFT_1951771 [Mycena sp. CBHHK59/15]|nr:hypothetical protein B0H10DRAFT_1951771 [Mycena sp. CBHHK59/15]
MQDKGLYESSTMFKLTRYRRESTGQWRSQVGVNTLGGSRREPCCRSYGEKIREGRQEELQLQILHSHINSRIRIFAIREWLGTNIRDIQYSCYTLQPAWLFLHIRGGNRQYPTRIYRDGSDIKYGLLVESEREGPSLRDQQQCNIEETGRLFAETYEGHMAFLENLQSKSPVAYQKVLTRLYCEASGQGKGKAPQAATSNGLAHLNFADMEADSD